MSTVFLGTSEFAAAMLERLAAQRRPSPGAGDHPARPPARPRPAADARRRSPTRARALGLALEQPRERQRSRRRALIAHALARRAARAGEAPTAAPTVIVCAFGALIKEPLLSEHELLNVHPSLLPRWRGAAPIERAIMAGDAQTGVSIMRLTAGLDSGPVCLAGVEPIARRRHLRLARRAPAGARRRAAACARWSERPPFVEQPEEGVTYAEKIGRRGPPARPARPAVELERVVRALHPHIGARVALADGDAARRAPRGAARRTPTAQARRDAAAGARARPARTTGALLLDCAPGVLELLDRAAAGRARDGRRRLSARSRAARARGRR